MSLKVRVQQMHFGLLRCVTCILSFVFLLFERPLFYSMCARCQMKVFINFVIHKYREKQAMSRRTTRLLLLLLLVFVLLVFLLLLLLPDLLRVSSLVSVRRSVSCLVFFFSFISLDNKEEKQKIYSSKRNTARSSDEILHCR